MAFYKDITKRVALGLLLIVLLGASGCSWTGSMLGFGDDDAAPESSESAKASETQDKDTTDTTKQASPTPTPPPAASTGATEDATKESGDSAANKEGQDQQKEEDVAPIEAKGAVPFEPTKERTPTVKGDIDYKTTAMLHKAVQKAIEKGTFLGYTDPFDAFPILDGDDTMSAAFIPVDRPQHKVFYHAFYTPDQPFHRRVYGYTVIDMTTNKDYGHFDGDADGNFEQQTLDPKIVLDKYVEQANKGKKAMEVNPPPKQQ